MPVIERAERLVEKQDLRPAEQGLRDRQPLLHAARERSRIEVARVGEADALQHGFGLLPGASAPGAEDAAKRPARTEILDQQQVLEGGQMRKHRIALEDNAALRRRLRHDRPVADDDHAPALLFLAEQDAQECRFSAAACADQRQEFARLGGDVDPLQHAGVAVAFLQSMDDDAAPLPCTA